MNRIAIPTVDQTPAASRPLLNAVNRQLGVVPNLMKVVGNSPAALEGYLGLSGALAKGTLGAKTGERIALAVAAVKAAGYNDAQVVEIVLHVSLNTLTNCVNEVAKTEIDFPVAPLRHAA